MFNYSPTVNDRSGEIMAAGQIGAASTNADMMNNLGSNIGGALTNIGKMYGSYIEDRVDGESSLQIIKGLSDSGYKPFADIYKNLMTLGPRAAGRAAQAVVGDAGGWISQVMISGQNNQMRQQAPYIQAGIKNQQNIAGGNVPHGGMGVPQSPAGMAPVEPDLPVGDDNLPAVQTTVPSNSIPGGDESMRRYKEWKRQRGY